MRILLHVGMPKSGTSVLQASLRAASGKLRKRGVAYGRTRLNHNLLVACMVPPERAGRVFAQRFAGDREAARAAFESFWRGIVDDALRRRPDTLILSGESLYGPLGDYGCRPLATLLAELDGEVEVVCYVRRPSDFYLSMTQQKLKASQALRPVGAVRYRPTLEAAARLGAAVHAIAYDRESFPGGDIVRDFVGRFLPEAAGLVGTVDNGKGKPSMSAEAMAIVQAHRRSRHPHEDDRFSEDTRLLIARLMEADSRNGGSLRPRLRDDVRRFIDQSSTDLPWLRAAHGVVFPGVDYEEIEAAPGWRPATVEDICVVDPERQARLAAAVAAYA